MKKATVIRDKISGEPFAIVLPPADNRVIAFGALGQGKLWAEWATLSKPNDSLLDNLDVSLAVEKEVELNDEFVDSLATTFAVADINELKFALSQKALLVIEKIKSLSGEEPGKYQQINEENDEDFVEKLPIVDSALATIDIAYKQIALDYKAKAFNLDSKRSSILVQVKGARAMWDPNMPGGGGWRCPEETTNGGQFTNRLGRGCTFGAIRRIGRALATASLRDISKGFDNPENIEFPTVYRAGKKIEKTGEGFDKRIADKYSRRALRRANKERVKRGVQNSKNARELLKSSRPTFRMRYESLGPTVSRRGRVLIAAAQSARDIAEDQVNRSFVSESRRASRRQGLPNRDDSPSATRKSPPDSSPISGTMSSAKRNEIAEKLRTVAQNIYEGRRLNRRNRKSQNEISRETANKENIVERFIRGTNPFKDRQTRALQRELRGRLPKSTNRLRERIEMRMRRAAKSRAEVMASDDDYPQYEPGKINRPEVLGGPRKLSEFLEPLPPLGSPRRAKLRWQTDYSVGLSDADEFKAPRVPVDAILMELSEHDISDGATPDTIKGIDDLDRFFKQELNHAAIARLREESLSQFDRDNQDALSEIYRDWLLSFNDPDEDAVPGSPSNMKLTDSTSVSWVSQYDPGFLAEADIDNQWMLAIYNDTQSPVPFSGVTPGDRTVLRATNLPGRPIVYIEDSEAQVAHLMTPEGKHLLTMVTDRPDSLTGETKVNFIAGSAALEKIAKRTLRTTAREKITQLTGRQRRREASLSKPAKKVRAQAIIDSDKSGLRFGKTSSGLKLAKENTVINDLVDREFLENAIKENIDSLERNLRNRLGFPDISKPISTADAVDRIEEVRKQSKQFAGILETDLHNFVTLVRAQESEDFLFLNDLKPGLRNKILAGINKSHLDTNADTVKDKWSVQPHAGTGKIPKLSKLDKLELRSPLLVSESTLGPNPLDSGTGPELIPGVGNPDLNISYEASSGLYVDNDTGLYIEDLSNLPIDATSIYKPMPLNESRTFPRVRISPAGVFPVRFATLAPGTDPNGPAVKGSDIPVETFKDAINVVSTANALDDKAATAAEKAVNKILGRNYGIEDLRNGLLVRIDARGWRSSDPTKANTPNQANVRSITFGELQSMANASIDSEQNSPLSDLGLSYASSGVGPETELGNAQNVIERITGNPAIETFGINLDGEPALFYLPADLSANSARNYGPEKMYGMLGPLNRALQLQHAADKRRSGLPSSSADALQADADKAWIDASRELSQAYAEFAGLRDDALEILDANPKNKNALASYLKHGALAESAKLLLDRHITSNPIVMNAIKKSKQREAADLAKSRNMRRKLAAERLAARANKGIPRNEGAFDNNPEVLDPWGTNTPPLQPRSIDEILLIRQQHRAEGLYDDPTQGISQLAQEQIDALIALDTLENRFKDAARGQGNGSTNGVFTGMEGTPFYGADFYPGMRGTLEDVQNAHFWFYNGSSSLPVLVNQKELEAMLTSLTPDGNRRAVVIARGVNATRGAARGLVPGGDARQIETEWVNQALRGDRFVPGAGGKDAGAGEYWSFNPGGTWSTYHGGNGGTMIAVLTEDSQLFQKDVFHGLFARAGELYEMMWGLYNAIGAPDSKGVNGNHGVRVHDLGLRVGSILPDPNTGQFTDAQISELEDAVAKMTATGGDLTRGRNSTVKVPDEWGIFTLEGLLRDGQRMGLSRAAMLELFSDVTLSPDTPENIKIIEETKALRQKINAWYAQHLSWFVQLAQMRRDESAPGLIGDENKAYNTGLNSAMRSLLYMGPEARASMLGIDAFVADLEQDEHVLPSQLWKAVSEPSSSAGDRVIVINRSGMIILRNGLDHFRSITDTLRNLVITTPEGPVSVIKNRSW